MLDTRPSLQRPLEPGTVISGATADTLSRIREAPVSLAVWERSMCLETVRWLDQTPLENLPTTRFVCHYAQARQRITQALALHAQSRAPAFFIFREDVIEQIERFAQVCGAPLVEVRLEAITGNACAKFHADNVTVRLLTTYRGPGTEWLDVSFGQELITVADYPAAAVRQVPRFAVGLFKGRRAASRSNPPVLHRSPPIEGTEQTRFLLCVSDAGTDSAVIGY